MKKSFALLVLIGFFSLSSFAASKSTVTYDLGGASGTRDGKTYSEVQLGLNWFVSDWFNWRNSLFSQFGDEMDSIYGLDSAALFKAEAYTQKRDLGVEVYAGPGVRAATEKSNAAFGKAGITFSLKGIRIGGGVQALHYFEDRFDRAANPLEKDEVQYFVILSGGGMF